MRLVSIEQGFDPRDFSLVAFGGAGPLHANALGKLIGAYPVIIPPSPGVLCAFGDATTLLRHEVGRSFIKALRQVDKDDVVNAFNELLKEVKQVMRDDQGVAEQRQVRSSKAPYLLLVAGPESRVYSRMIQAISSRFDVYIRSTEPYLPSRSSLQRTGNQRSN